jgi:hypothetical protein
MDDVERRKILPLPTHSQSLYRLRYPGFLVLNFKLNKYGVIAFEWIQRVQDRDQWQAVVSAVMNDHVLWKTGNFLSNVAIMNFSKNILLHGVNYYVKISYDHSLHFKTLYEMLRFVRERLRKTWKIRQDRFLTLKRLTAAACGPSYCDFAEELVFFWACELISRVVWKWRVM